jgi:hypothetical protein
MHSVSSRAIEAIGYDSATQRLRITFRQGRTYDYCRVPAHIYEQFIRARSKGGFFNSHIDGRYQC